MLWLYLDFPQIQLDNLLLEQANQSVAIIIIDASENNIVQLNQTALNAGIKPNMGLATALALHHDLHPLEYNEQLEHQQLKQIAEWLYQYSADIALNSPKGLYLKVDSMLALYGNFANYWQNIQQVLNSLNYQFNYAVAKTPLAAKILASTRSQTFLLKETQQQAQLKCMPIEVLFQQRKTVQQLQRIGINTIGQLQTLPIKELNRRFDKNTINRLYQLSGQQHHGLTFFEPTLIFRQALELLFEVTNSNLLLTPIQALLKRLTLFLIQRNLVTQNIKLHLTQKDHDALQINIASAKGQQQAAAWLRLIELKFESVVLQSPVTDICLSCNQFEPQHSIMQDMFNQQESGLAPNELINQLEAKLGEDYIFKLSLKDTFHPALASHEQKAISAVHSALPLNKQNRPLRPSFVLNKPQVLSEPVELVLGPERVQTNWWDKHELYRDYFVARNNAGQLHWIYRQPNGNWFTHGLFA
ncbi:hypothetical protein C2869_11595 [Saccharobesus litoralis]|uniref:UmuC domain-containing protein n=1 Tax=Saccharobesus litoralis TaxID=2172099 RepID=A0A2S0VS52_9ALTE|nr:DNA polymerase Y family protein [Saccharobesus litoralis]AWB67037.1 hypothetical protein C2869_11595 [Saccharobesus litoralis]